MRSQLMGGSARLTEADELELKLQTHDFQAVEVTVARPLAEALLKAWTDTLAGPAPGPEHAFGVLP